MSRASRPPETAMESNTNWPTRHQSHTDTSGGRGGGEGGKWEGGRVSVLTKRLKSGSDHHRLDVCGASNGCHKLA